MKYAWTVMLCACVVGLGGIIRTSTFHLQLATLMAVMAIFLVLSEVRR